MRKQAVPQDKAAIVFGDIDTVTFVFQPGSKGWSQRGEKGECHVWLQCRQCVVVKVDELGGRYIISRSLDCGWVYAGTCF